MAVLPKKPLRKVRVPRSESVELQMEDAGHLWAVSYSDFLMVLLSFFVIFFSVEKNQKGNFVRMIMAKVPTVKGVDNSQTGDKNSLKHLNGIGVSSSGGGGIPTDLPVTLRDVFHGRSIQTKVDAEKMVIDFPDEFYHPGEVELKGENLATFDLLIEKLRPFQSQIVIGFVGHADVIPVRAGRQLSTNVDLSVVRASKALARAAKEGMPIESLYATGSGTGLRNSRSLSIVIKPLAMGFL